MKGTEKQIKSAEEIKEKAMEIYCAEITPCSNTYGEYEMGEISLCEYGAEWNGDVRGYIENAIDDADIHDEGMLGVVHQNFGGLDPVPGSIYVLLSNNKPIEVYWASTVRAGWAE